MPIVVQKYGGTSVGDPERICRVAERIAGAREEGHDVVAVVSAMGHSTDELLEMAASITPTPEPRERQYTGVVEDCGDGTPCLDGYTLSGPATLKLLVGESVTVVGAVNGDTLVVSRVLR